MQNSRFILGVCGRIGSGKTEVLGILRRHGWVTIDADEVVRELYRASGKGQRKIVDFFGEEFLRSDGSVNRQKLRGIVFGDVKKLKILNSLIHPLVFNEISKILDAKKGTEKIAIEAVYFEEKFLGKKVDSILCVERPIEEIRKFLIEERGFSKDIAENVLGLDVVSSRLDVRVDNNSTLKALEKKVIIEVEKLIQ